MYFGIAKALVFVRHEILHTAGFEVREQIDIDVIAVRDVDQRLERNAAFGVTAVNFIAVKAIGREKSILRLSVFEMVYDKLPVKISINEAVELAKIYGREQSYSFVNGVLARIVKGLDKDGQQSSSE